MLELSINDAYTIKIKIINDGTFYEDVARIKSIQGRRWEPEGKYWTIPLASKELLVGLFHESEVRWVIPKGENNQTSNSSCLPQFDIDTNHLDKMKLTPYDFQIIGMNFLSKIKKCLLGDEMGLGDFLGYVK